MLEAWNKLSKEEQQEKVQRQLKMEERLVNSGVDRYWNEYSRAPDDSAPESGFLKEAVEYLGPYYEEWIKKVCANPRTPNWLHPLMAIGPYKMADITIRSVMRMFLSRSVMQDYDDDIGIPASAPLAQQVATMIGDDVVNVVAYMKAKKQFSKDWNNQSKFIKNWTPKRCVAFSKKMGTITKMSKAEKEDLGHNMLRIALATDILVSRIHWTGKKKKMLLVSLAPWVLKELGDKHKLMESECMVYRPMLCPPTPHTVSNDGGFLSSWLRKKVIRRYSPVVGSMGDVVKSEPSQLVIDGLNALGNTEWTINDDVLTVMKTIFENDMQIANMPSKSYKNYDFAIPYPKEGTKEEKAIWMKDANEAWGAWYKDEQSRSRMIVRLDLAESMKEAGMFYMPYTLDFRGRAYSICELLSPQSVDFDRGLIKFKTPRKQTPEGIEALKIYIACKFDIDKKGTTKDEWIKWVDDNMDMFREIAADPIGNTQWVDNKDKKSKSFQRLAAIFEIVRTDGLTQLNIQIDGVNNGVQHWCAIMRDKGLAVLTNLIDSGKKMDLYERVGEDTAEFMHSRPDNFWYPVCLEHWGGTVSRNVAKRPTMCDGYGITFYGIQKYLKQEGHMDWVPKESRNGAITEVARAIMAGLEKTMHSPNMGKNWLREVADVVNEEEKSISWTAPSGFVVHHTYNKIKERISYAQLFNKRQLYFSEVSEDLDPRAQYMAIAPNFIHSLDAAHMFMTLVSLLNKGVSGFSFVHDSFGTYAPDIPIMHSVLREKFVEIHKEDILGKFKEEVEAAIGSSLPDCPKRLDEFEIEEVYRSPYSFT